MGTEARLYAKLTLDFADSHKVAPLSDGAFRALVRMILWSRRMLTDGRIPGPMARVFAKPKQLAELTSNDPVNPSLRVDGDDYWIHDFLEHQSSKAQVEAMQEASRLNGSKGGRPRNPKGTQTKPGDNPGGYLDETQTEPSENTESESQRETETTPPVSMSSHLLKREAPQIDLEKVRAAVQARTGRTCTDMGIVRIIGTVMERAKQNPRDKTAYVVRAIDNDPFVWQQFIDEEGLSA